MRPLRIEMEGFSAFREPTVVDFTDADLFAFVGPTGAGKSSVIDALIFALYGSVPRLDARLVHPVITQGKPEAKVRLDFEVGGRIYTAVRVVRRTKDGASTKEARLERGDEVLAEDVRTMNPAVVEVLGLELDQFTKCVVLPQGAFAALLHETRKHRQELLVRLLDLGVYGDVAQAARRRTSAADQRLAVLGEQIEGLAGATDDAVAAAEARVDALGALVGAIVEGADQLELLNERLRTMRTSHETLVAQRASVAAIEAPADLATIGAASEEAAAALEAALEAEEAASTVLRQAEVARADAGDAADVARRLAALDELAKLRDRIVDGVAKTDAQRSAVEPLRAAAEAAAGAVTAAAAALEAARVHHAASDLARHLHVGDDCPVCGSRVDELPTVDAAELERAETAHADVLARQRAADASLAEAVRDLDRFEAKLAELREQEAERVASAGDLDRDALLGRQQRIAAADEALVAATEADRAARAGVAAARKRVEQCRIDIDRSRRALHQARDGVAALAPPALVDDLADDWAALTSWASVELEELLRQVDERATEIRSLEKERDEIVTGLTERARAHGLTASEPKALRDAAVSAAAASRHELERLVADRTRLAALTAERTGLQEQRAVLETVARRLHPDSFQKWLLGEALAALVAGASARLEELSSGRYGLVLDDDEFAVVDHANADEQRMARTLSGGETFLASLALALALAERVSELSATARVSLDAIFLDEGFGTLDPETLDVVASAIEELGARGRMVGIVSHVRDLAERVPVRYEVRPGARTSTVERVEV